MNKIIFRNNAIKKLYDKNNRRLFLKDEKYIVNKPSLELLFIVIMQFANGKLN